MITRARKDPLYKPAVFAKLLDRPDVQFAVAFQNEVVFQKNHLELSSYMSSHFGLTVENLNVFVGVPDKLWPAFSRINWQSFHIETDVPKLILYYDVEVEVTRVKKASYGATSTNVTEAHRLQFHFPLYVEHARVLSNCSILHITCMNSDKTKHPDFPPISITKVSYND